MPVTAPSARQTGILSISVDPTVKFAIVFVSPLVLYQQNAMVVSIASSAMVMGLVLTRVIVYARMDILATCVKYIVLLRMEKYVEVMVLASRMKFNS